MIKPLHSDQLVRSTMDELKRVIANNIRVKYSLSTDETAKLLAHCDLTEICFTTSPNRLEQKLKLFLSSLPDK
jgi:hypothetical protein